MLPTWASGPKFGSQHPGTVIQARETEKSGSLELIGQPVWLNQWVPRSVPKNEGEKWRKVTLASGLHMHPHVCTPMYTYPPHTYMHTYNTDTSFVPLSIWYQILFCQDLNPSTWTCAISDALDQTMLSLYPFLSSGMVGRCLRKRWGWRASPPDAVCGAYFAGNNSC